MPIEFPHPGVYSEEMPSGSHTITPVPTSIAAFVGRAPVGPIDLPVTIDSFSDFARIFGGLAADYPLTYAVQDFFANGGGQAVICRLFEPVGDASDGIGRLVLAPGLELRAASPGVWSDRLAATVDTRGLTPQTATQFAPYGLALADLFNLTLTLTNAKGQLVETERYLNLSVRTDGPAARYPNRLDRTLAGQSTLARVATLSATPPSDGASVTASGGDDGTYLTTPTWLGDRASHTGLYQLERIPTFNLLCLPPDRRITATVDEGLDPVVVQAAASYCTDRRAFFIVDPPARWTDAVSGGRLATINAQDVGIDGGGEPTAARNAAVYFPRIVSPDPLDQQRPALFAPCGAIAGIYAATDVARGVWKAPAGQSAGLADVTGFEIDLTDDQVEQLAALGINVLRRLPNIGPVVWGARTLRGADGFADDYKYVPVRRLVLFIGESLLRGLSWAVFEPNDEALWASLRLEVDRFLVGLGQQGAFFNHAVRCDASTTTPDDIAKGVVNILVMIAAVRPAEFIVLQIQQVVAVAR